MKKVSFDFDSTLDRPKVQKFAIQLVEKGFEVWIVTSRYEYHIAPAISWNNYLFSIASACGIMGNHIYFTNMRPKWEFLKDKGFLFHLDDDWIELKEIEQYVKNTVAVNSFGNPKWKEECIKALGMKPRDFIN